MATKLLEAAKAVVDMCEPPAMVAPRETLSPQQAVLEIWAGRVDALRAAIAEAEAAEKAPEPDEVRACIGCSGNYGEHKERCSSAGTLASSMAALAAYLRVWKASGTGYRPTGDECATVQRLYDVIAARIRAREAEVERLCAWEVDARAAMEAVGTEDHNSSCPFEEWEFHSGGKEYRRHEQPPCVAPCKAALVRAVLDRKVT